MSERKVGLVAKALIDAKARIADPENWWDGRSRIGNRRCAQSAIVGHGMLNGAWDALKTSSRLLFDRPLPRQVNDDPNLGHSAVMQLYDHAISRALSEGK